MGYTRKMFQLRVWMLTVGSNKMTIEEQHLLYELVKNVSEMVLGFH